MSAKERNKHNAIADQRRWATKDNYLPVTIYSLGGTGILPAKCIKRQRPSKPAAPWN